MSRHAGAGRILFPAGRIKLATQAREARYRAVARVAMQHTAPRRRLQSRCRSSKERLRPRDIPGSHGLAGVLHQTPGRAPPVFINHRLAGVAANSLFCRFMLRHDVPLLFLCRVPVLKIRVYALVRGVRKRGLPSLSAPGVSLSAHAPMMVPVAWAERPKPVKIPKAG